MTTTGAAAAASASGSTECSFLSAAEDEPPPSYLPNQASLDFLWDLFNNLDDSDIALSYL